MNRSIRSRIENLEAIARRKRDEEQALIMRLASEIESDGSEKIMSSVASVREEIHNLQEAIDIAQEKLISQEKIESSKEYQVQLKKLNSMNRERKESWHEIIQEAQELLLMINKHRASVIEYDAMRRRITGEQVLLSSLQFGVDGWIMRLHRLLKSWLNDKKWIEERLKR